MSTPAAWLDAAVADLSTVLLDHADCEKKAAGTALSLLYRYPDRRDLTKVFSRLAREELRHFELVQGLLVARGVKYVRLSAGRYAGALRSIIRNAEPYRLIDTLIVGAVIEARSCERFGALLGVLEDPLLRRFYARLMDSEARHFADYLDQAERAADHAADDGYVAQVKCIVTREAQLILAADNCLRFHSGPPTTTC